VLIIGERLNTTRREIAAIVEGLDGPTLRREARRQIEAGAHYVDVNAGTFRDREPELLRWMVTMAQAGPGEPGDAGVAGGLCIDSPNPEAIEVALRVHRGKAIVNSITGEKARLERLLPVVKAHGSAVVALCLDDDGMPTTAVEATAKGVRLVETLLEAGLPADDIYIDPVVRPVSVDPDAAAAAIETIRRLRDRFPEAHFICGLSNVSFGLPARSLANRTFLAAAMSAGLDAAILDPLDSALMTTLLAAEAVLGLDRYCSRYLKAYRKGRLA
jgi:5-methyltetrahydrofolate corrinoid/iron sulfur protein methyltransferase